MPTQKNGKLKILYVKDWLEQSRGEENLLTTAELIARLGCLGIVAERKSIYDDIRILRLYGLPVRNGRRGKAQGFYVE